MLWIVLSQITPSRILVNRLEYQFLDAPVEDFGNVEFVFGGAGHFVDPVELAELLAGFAEDAENFSVESEFVNGTGETVGTVEGLIWCGRDANGPGRAGRHRSAGGGGLVPDGGASVGFHGNINGDLAGQFSTAVENLDAAEGLISWRRRRG
jgi:hypothetical protein